MSKRQKVHISEVKNQSQSNKCLIITNFTKRNFTKKSQNFLSFHICSSLFWFYPSVFSFSFVTMLRFQINVFRHFPPSPSISLLTSMPSTSIRLLYYQFINNAALSPPTDLPGKVHRWSSSIHKQHVAWFLCICAAGLPCWIIWIRWPSYALFVVSVWMDWKAWGREVQRA